MIDPRAWHRDQCEAFSKDCPIYEVYATTLEAILKAICRTCAPMAIVQSRVKSKLSFAGKMARKAGRYMASGEGPTDLCGARVITETRAEVERVCAAIRNAFTIDEANSLDKRAELKPSEFGYTSVHYVVQLRGAEILGVPIPPEIGDRKAEIQVRTLLEHAWDRITHDRLYKTSFRVPDSLARNLARVSALLEEANAEFSACVAAIESYKLDYGRYLDEQQLRAEVEILETVRDSESDPAAQLPVVLQLARLARASGDWERVAQLLAPYLTIDSSCHAEALAEHGHALCQIGHDQPAGDPFMRGRSELAQAADLAKGDLRARVVSWRAWASSRIADNDAETLQLYRDAFDVGPGNPFHLAAYLGYEIHAGTSIESLGVVRPQIRAALATCRDYANAGIELPWAFFTMGRLHLLTAEAHESLAAYAKGIRLLLASPANPIESALDEEIRFVRRVRGRGQPSEGNVWARHLLELAQLAAKPSSTSGGSITIIAGGTSLADEPTLDAARATIHRAFRGYAGTIISGGTTVGVAGLAGELAAANPGARVVGYLPRRLPVGQVRDDRYTELIACETDQHDLSIPLRYWSDLLHGGVRPADVRLLGIDGGPISAFEYRLALALGAQVGLLDPHTREAAVLAKDPDWSSDRNLVSILNDAMVLRAFVIGPAPALTPVQIDAAACAIHTDYLAQTPHANPDPAMQPWDHLRDDLKDSNRHQTASMATFLAEIGYRAEPAAGDITPVALTDEEVEKLAEREHGRWVVERLRAGWRYDKERDAAKKRSPFLVPWDRLEEKIKERDRQPVRSWPRLLAAAGLRLVR